MSVSLRFYAPVIFVTFAWSLVSGFGQDLRAEESVAKPTAQAESLRHSQANGWHIAESRNFRFHHHSQSALVTRLAKLCEDSRLAIRQRWLTSSESATWSIKCDVFLYPTTVEYEQKTRFPANSWGFAGMEIGDGKVWMRRLDLRSDNDTQLMTVAIHELTHVVLADRFAHRQIPRWADEGIALNSEPAARQENMRDWLVAEIQQGRGFSLSQLMNMRQYPQDKHLGELFYAQSGSLITFMLTQNAATEETVLRFVETSQQNLNQAVSTATLAKLEADWKAWLLSPPGNSESSVPLAATRP